MFIKVKEEFENKSKIKLLFNSVMPDFYVVNVLKAACPL